MSLELTKGQSEALEMIEALTNQIGYDVGVLEGHAGSGKSTLLGAIKEHLPDLPGITILCPTGKAAVRVKEATGLEAGTIHRFLYGTPKYDKATNKLVFPHKTKLDRVDGHLIVVDEASMLGAALWNDLHAACESMGNVRVLLVGDPFQLPPVARRGEEPWCALQVPTDFRVQLTEIVRQAAGSPIICAATKIRGGANISSLLGLLRHVMPDEIPAAALDTWERGGATLVHSNDLRQALNRRVRHDKGLPPGLVPGEPLLVLQNNYQLDHYNGEIIPFEGWTKEKYCKGRADGLSVPLDFSLTTVDGQEAIVAPEQIAGCLDKYPDQVQLVKQAGDKAWRDRRGIERDDKGKPLPTPLLQANHGYALTTHKAQGSEYDDVLVVIEKSVRLGTEEGQRHLYTSVTRARERCSIATVPWGFDTQI